MSATFMSAEDAAIERATAQLAAAKTAKNDLLEARARVLLQQEKQAAADAAAAAAIGELVCEFPKTSATLAVAGIAALLLASSK